MRAAGPGEINWNGLKSWEAKQPGYTCAEKEVTGVGLGKNTSLCEVGGSKAGNSRSCGLARQRRRGFTRNG